MHIASPVRFIVSLVSILYLTACMVQPIQEITSEEHAPPMRLTWIKADNERNSFGYSVTGVGDVNGDGYDDFMVGWLGEGWTGEVDVFAGGPDGPIADPFLSITGTNDETSMGRFVSPAGDMDNDGRAEIVVEEATFAEGRGRASLYAMDDTVNPRWQVEGAEENAGFATSVDGPGDVNGDGYDDLLVGAPGMHDGAGQANLYLGGPDGLNDTPDWVLTGDRSQRIVQRGYSVSGIGDVNGDNFADIAIGAQDITIGTPGIPLPLLDIFLGSATGPQPTNITLLSNSDNLGVISPFIAQAGDINGDGYDDLVISSEIDDQRGRVSLYYGNEDGIDPAPHQELEGDSDMFAFGSPAIGVGDINQDGYDDLAIGYVTTEMNYDNEIYVLRAELRLGSNSGLAPEPAFHFPAQEIFNQDAYAIAPTGDVDGDGFADVVVGNPNALNERGRIYIFSGLDQTSVIAPADANDPQDVIETIFRAANTGDLSELDMLCDPYGENDWPSQYICDRGFTPFWFDASWPDWFQDMYQAGEITSDVTIDPDGQFARLTFSYPNDVSYIFGNQADVVLIQRGNRWYLYDMDVSEDDTFLQELRDDLQEDD